MKAAKDKVTKEDDRVQLSELHSLPRQGQNHVIIVDLEHTPYIFPTAIASTDQHPDIVIWSQHQNSATLVELTVCYETNFIQAHQRKTNKYQDSRSMGGDNGYEMEIITLEDGSRGFLNLDGFQALL